MVKKKTEVKRGRTMTTPGGLIRKVSYLHEDEAEALRIKAFEERRTESDVIREALRRFLEIED